MSGHLTDEQIAAAVAALELEDQARRHLDCCIDCRASVSEMRILIETRRLRLAAGEPDWEARRARVLAGLDGVADGRRRRRWRAPALAAAAAVVMAVAAGVVMMPGDPADQRDEIVLDEVLAEAETLLADRSIPGFELIDPGFEGFEDYLAGDAADGGAS
jgi:hypothetical protein